MPNIMPTISANVSNDEKNQFEKNCKENDTTMSKVIKYAANNMPEILKTAATLTEDDPNDTRTPLEKWWNQPNKPTKKSENYLRAWLNRPNDSTEKKESSTGYDSNYLKENLPRIVNEVFEERVCKIKNLQHEIDELGQQAKQFREKKQAEIVNLKAMQKQFFDYGIILGRKFPNLDFRNWSNW